MRRLEALQRAGQRGEAPVEQRCAASESGARAVGRGRAPSTRRCSVGTQGRRGHAHRTTTASPRRTVHAMPSTTRPARCARRAGRRLYGPTFGHAVGWARRGSVSSAGAGTGARTEAQAFGDEGVFGVSVAARAARRGVGVSRTQKHAAAGGCLGVVAAANTSYMRAQLRSDDKGVSGDVATCELSRIRASHAPGPRNWVDIGQRCAHRERRTVLVVGVETGMTSGKARILDAASSQLDSTTDESTTRVREKLSHMLAFIPLDISTQVLLAP